MTPFVFSEEKEGFLLRAWGDGFEALFVHVAAGISEALVDPGTVSGGVTERPTSTSSHSVTLHAVPNGNARSVDVQPDALNFDNLVKVQP